ncbi:hypothetical protein JZM30_08055 [Candidatus Symbiopectobacterium endolongispinus]|nr:hypothetical protein [Candidatus Symbiopectobacterium sp. PLON1]MBT9429116.1 hypothetical protein [Candidatus Symbiopectobacterium endolongispinus]
MRHPLELLFKKTRETVDISTFHGQEVIFLDRIISDQMPSLTSQTLISLPVLLQQIAAVRADGFSYDREEHAEGVCAVGIALPVPGRPAHALSVVLPSYRFAARLPAIQQALEEVR